MSFAFATPRPGLDLDRFLGRHGSSFGDLRTAVSARIKGHADIAFVSGSLVCGNGTPLSDIDIYVLARSTPPGARQIEQFTVGTALVDLEWWDLPRVSNLIERLQGMPASSDRDLRDVLSFSPYERELLHRLHVGRAVVGGLLLEGLQNRIDPLALARLLFDRALIRVANAHADLVGAIHQSDLATAVLIAARMIDETLDLLLAAHGNTNPEEKWRLNRVRQLPEGWDTSLPLGALPRPAADLWLSHYFPRHHHPAGLIEHMRTVVALSNRIVPWSQRKMASEEGGGTSIAFPPPEPGGAANPLPPLSMSARVRWQAPSYLISHADGRHVLELNELGYRIVLMLDGRRSAQDIASDLESRFSLPPRSVRAALESILKSLSRHEYLESNVG